MTALEARSKEILAEKEAKRQLEVHIAGLQSQLLLGGHKIEDSPAFRYNYIKRSSKRYMKKRDKLDTYILLYT